MYSSYFGFSDKPFEVTPDPKYLYASPSHKEMLASLVYGIRERRGFICLTGEVGTGKTMLINAALDRLDERTKVAYIGNTALTFGQLLSVTLEELGILEEGKQISKVKSIRLLNKFTLDQLSAGGNVVMIIDEAQNLAPDSMENLRLLSNLETRKHKLIQIVLAGQPELEKKLDRPELRQLTQRISVRRVIKPLSEEETFAYIQHRLTVAGCRESELFNIQAQKMIYEYTGGIPRKINILCDNALLIGYALKKRTIDADCVSEAANDLKYSQVVKTEAVEPDLLVAGEHPPQSLHNRSRRKIALAGGMALATGLVVSSWIAFSRSGPTFSVTPNSLPKSDILPGVHFSQKSDGRSVTEPISVYPVNAISPDKIIVERVADPTGIESSSLDDEESRVPAGPIVLSSDLKKQKVAMHSEASSELEAAFPIKNALTENAEMAPAKKVVVEQGDYLRKIIQQAYGKCL